MNVITIERKILERNDEIARRNRELCRQRGVFAINLVSSPGAGKTSLLERTLEGLGGELRLAVIEGDIQTDLDARRVARFGIPVAQIVTHGACHLEAQLVRDALERLDLAGVELLVIENVGNLVCPASYDLGEAMKVVILSTPEGDDKPLKYPAMFRSAAALIINKIDLLPHLSCDPAAMRRHAQAVNPELRIFELSCRTGEGVAAWCRWLREQCAAKGR